MSYVVIGGPEPGYAESWPDAHRRSHRKRGSYTKKVTDIHEARAYYESVTGTPLPEVKPGRRCKIRVENDNGVLEVRSVTARQVAALQAVGLWL